MKKVQLAADDPSQTWTGAELHVLQMNNDVYFQNCGNEKHSYFRISVLAKERKSSRQDNWQLCL